MNLHVAKLTNFSSCFLGIFRCILAEQRQENQVRTISIRAAMTWGIRTVMGIENSSIFGISTFAIGIWLSAEYDSHNWTVQILGFFSILHVNLAGVQENAPLKYLAFIRPARSIPNSDQQSELNKQGIWPAAFDAANSKD